MPARFNFTRDVVEALAADPLKQALTFVDREGIVDRRSFHEIAGDAARWAHLMRTRLDRGDRVVLAIGKVPSWQAAMLGALKSGLVAVPCPDMLRARDLAFRVHNSGARLVVADRSLELEIEEMRHQVGASVSVLFLDEALDELRRYMPVAPTEDTTAGETALILYTSGTDKDPKGVVHTHAYTWAQRAQATHWLDAHEGDVVWCTSGTGWAKAIWNSLSAPGRTVPRSSSTRGRSTPRSGCRCCSGSGSRSSARRRPSTGCSPSWRSWSSRTYRGSATPCRRASRSTPRSSPASRTRWA